MKEIIVVDLSFIWKCNTTLSVKEIMSLLVTDFHTKQTKGRIGNRKDDRIRR